MPDREPASDIAWLEPYPDAALEGLADTAPGPDARYETREAVNLAFIAAIQHLPPQQRAVLLLRDVMGWSAAETAGVIESSVAAVNSALQRARAALERRFPTGRPPRSRPTTERERELLERYVRAWESSDVDRFAELLREDASFRMPPWPQWYRGRGAMRRFFAWATRLGGRAPFRLLPTRANGHPAFAFYGRWPAPEWRFHSVQIVTVEDELIADLTSFVMPELARVFDMSGSLPPEGGS
jgi:RNA polymerase sigma-70 factor (ECF subfamily)